ncbi:hypothetical protein DESUT3_15430 [Desulfuromonas versatilis]|uniref:HTH tetR-type domain-containing protein n=1 Tax=Desulfuromonas versatilis TaxID=2802975 RepID=A0ABM8HRB1_9BACT|nr:hypothetical protein DESUT3_15430 [Desulfuromonas versatilis]
MTTKEQIASRLEQAFSQRGFAEPGVAELKILAGVSLRTLYRYFPSKESMVIGALDYRHGRYLKFLAEDEPPPGRESIVHLFHRLADWMRQKAPHGCLSVNAFAAYPSSLAIRDAVKLHKDELVRLLARRSGREALGWELFLIHEGVSAAWPLVGMRASEAGETAVLKLIDGGIND